jgi:3-phenylpropionate/cinnamic acid dioxygenase small subunit
MQLGLAYLAKRSPGKDTSWCKGFVKSWPMPNSFADQSEQLAYLLDRQAIVDLTVAYTWALDTRQPELLSEVFSEDATALLRGVACEGREAIVTRISGAILRLDATQHLVGNHQVEIEGDRATCRCHLQSQHVKAGTEGGDNFLIGGIYLDELERRPEGWRIVRREMRQVWSDGNPAVVRRG